MKLKPFFLIWNQIEKKPISIKSELLYFAKRKLKRGKNEEKKSCYHEVKKKKKIEKKKNYIKCCNNSEQEKKKKNLWRKLMFMNIVMCILNGTNFYHAYNLTKMSYKIRNN